MARFQVLIVDQKQEDESLAGIQPAGFETDVLKEALTWAKAFNAECLKKREPVWAVVHRGGCSRLN